MTESEALRARRALLFERIAATCDEVARIDCRLVRIECNDIEIRSV